jgi:hypothetical protein
MDILTPLLTITGKPVAKYLLKKYLAKLEDAHLLSKELSEAGEGVGEQLTDIAAEKLASKVDQRQAARIFEDIADKIVLQLAPLFEEAQKQGHLNIEAIIFELGRALSGKISADLLLTRELDPAKLATAFREVHPLPRAQFSEAETALYERALDQTARYLVAVASQLPQFEIKLAATQLQSIARMQDNIARTLESVRKIEEQVTALSPNKAYAKFEADYRQAVVQNVDELELFGVDVEPQSKRYRLSVAYISLSLQEESTGDEDSTLISAEHLLQQLRPGAGRLLIRGEAGSGKSTLFRWAALIAATGGQTGNRSFALTQELATDWNQATTLAGGLVQLHHHGGSSPPIADLVRGIDLLKWLHGDASKYENAWYLRVPILIRLRDCKDGRLPAIEELTTQIAWTLGAPPSGWIKSFLEEGRALVPISVGKKGPYLMG